MPSVNKIVLVGHLGKDPEMRYTASGIAQLSFSLATSRNIKQQDGTWKEDTDWHNVTLFGDAAERTGERLHKGSLAYVEGRVSYRTWQSDDGVRHDRTEIVADRALSLDAKRAGDSESPARNTRGSKPPLRQRLVDPDDLPFE